MRPILFCIRRVGPNGVLKKNSKIITSRCRLMFQSLIDILVMTNVCLKSSVFSATRKHKNQAENKQLIFKRAQVPVGAGN